MTGNEMDHMVEIKPGPDLDRAVAEAIGYQPRDFNYNPDVRDEPCSAYFRGCDSGIVRGEVWIWANGVDFKPFRPSTDLNAAFAAAERAELFSETFWRTLRMDELGEMWSVFETGDCVKKSIVGEYSTPALAICAAILELRRKEDGDGTRGKQKA